MNEESNLDILARVCEQVWASTLLDAALDCAIPTPRAILQGGGEDVADDDEIELCAKQAVVTVAPTPGAISPRGGEDVDDVKQAVAIITSTPGAILQEKVINRNVIVVPQRPFMRPKEDIVVLTPMPRKRRCARGESCDPPSGRMWAMVIETPSPLCLEC